MSIKLESELSEKQIEADIATYFGWITPPVNDLPFRLKDIDEQVTGADKLFDLVIPIYMQFKVSHGLTMLRGNIVSNTFSFIFKLKGAQRIRAFRSREGLFDNPTLYFKLRAKAKTAVDFQHNILMKLANRGNSHAFYVAPLTLEKRSYEELMFNSSSRFLDYPFQFPIITAIHQERWISYFGFVPILRGNISITPHEMVSTDQHYYSFSPNGTDIAWHSPQIIGNGIYRLSDRMNVIFSQAFNYGPNSWVKLDDYLPPLLKDDAFNFFKPDNESSEIENLSNFGRALYNKYEIRQFLFLGRSDYFNFR